jgi:hypothetical protein
MAWRYVGDLQWTAMDEPEATNPRPQLMAAV